ncbi:BQ5605_C004g03109 [Microbotryum silenes-dioicae]|uniref:BQ5605_C004g03109 protein n=1 Tax=Microbotryum silenes-dioicae TaxID=796604 RepID=A0A2X0MD34_9BASI|nr:BQ5605_C004g03109 [Microbotryum silenes-dioicae]
MSFEDSRAAWRLRQRAVPYPTMPTMAVRERAFKSGRALTGRADASSSALRDGAPAAAPAVRRVRQDVSRYQPNPRSHTDDSEHAVMVAAGRTAESNEMYAMCILRYLEYCDDELVDRRDRFPAPPDVVRRFLTRIALSGNGVGAYSVSHFRRFRTALDFWHTTHRLRMNYDPKMWTMQLAADAATAPAPKPERLAATLDEDEEFIAERHLAVANARRIDATSEAPLRFELDLPFDKVRRRVGRTLGVSARDDEPFCPVGGIDNHFRLNDLPPGRLFSYQAREGGHRQLTSSAFSRRIKHILEASGRAVLNNHSFRSGEATFYLREGVHTDHIRNLGRWSSNAFDGYWRQHKEIAIRVLGKAGKLALDPGRASMRCNHHPMASSRKINHLSHPNATKHTERYTRKVAIPFPRSRTHWHPIETSEGKSELSPANGEPTASRCAQRKVGTDSAGALQSCKLFSPASKTLE